jgi:hypothetical protein
VTSACQTVRSADLCPNGGHGSRPGSVPDALSLIGLESRRRVRASTGSGGRTSLGMTRGGPAVRVRRAEAGLSLWLVGGDGGDAAACALCGRRIDEVDGGAGWMHLEITRRDPPEDFEYLDADLCTQAHAAEWLSRPLPPPPPPISPRVDRRERLLEVGFILLAVWSLSLMLLGAYALVRLSGGWD